MKHLLSLLLLLVVCASCAMDFQHQFQQFKLRYNKSYKFGEELRRFTIFKDNLRKAAGLQSANPQATFGVTKFSDLTAEEFSLAYLKDTRRSIRNLPKAPETPQPPQQTSCNRDPVTFDYSSCGVITPVINEGMCGAVDVITIVEQMESWCALSGLPLQSLSIEQITDCVGIEGCSGELNFEQIYEYIMEEGIEPASDYNSTGACNYDSSDVYPCKLLGAINVTGEAALYRQLSAPSGGPILACVDSSSWQLYTGGVITSCGNQIDHCVQLTGYANYGESGAYWNVKNSWGEEWGNDGYIWIAIGQDLCGIADYASTIYVIPQ